MGKIIATRSLVPNSEVVVTDSNEEEEQEQAQLAMVVPVVKETLINYRGRNAALSSVMLFDYVDLQKESPNPLEQYRTGGEINEEMMQDTTPSELFQGCSSQISIQGSATSESV